METNRKTLSPVIWFQYFCWNVQFWMNTHKPYYPLRLRIWLLNGYDERRHQITRQMVRVWENLGRTEYPEPLPWYIGTAALGPFVGPWSKAARFFRRLTGGRSHRCEFTDPEQGALYGGKEGAFMDRYFEQFIANISRDVDVIDWLETDAEMRKN
jgi:hypothetical protein